jgi:hypothetical protein
MENTARKFGLQINQEKTKYMIVERKNSLKQNKVGHLKIKYYKFERVSNFKNLEIRQLFVKMENTPRKFGLLINHEKAKYMIVERKKFKTNEIGY